MNDENNKTLADIVRKLRDYAVSVDYAGEYERAPGTGPLRDIANRIEELLAQDALSVPPRNCDVGTAEEQHRRFVDYCNECDCPMGCIHRKEFFGMLDTRCASMLKCYIRWSQMPYKEGEGAE